MRLMRTTVTLAGVLLLGSLAGCAEYTTTGVPEGEEVVEVDAHSAEGNPLVGTAWVLIDAPTSEVDFQDIGVTADFFEEQVSGQAPVNSYFAGYVVEGESIEIEEIGTTLTTGPDGLMAAEREYVELLESADSFEATQAQLVLKAEGVEVLEFVSADEEGTSADVEASGAGEDISTVAESVIGLSVDEAEETAGDAGYVFRVTAVDGEALAVTLDYREDRINAQVEDDEVVAVTIG